MVIELCTLRMYAHSLHPIWKLIINNANVGLHKMLRNFVVQLLSHVRLFETPRTAAQASLSSTISWCLLRFMSIVLEMLSDYLILCCTLLILPSTFPSIRVFSNDLALVITWPKYWSFSFSISPSMNIQGWFPLGLTGLISLHSKGLSRVFFNTAVRMHQFFSNQPSLRSSSHICTWLMEKPYLCL